MVKWFYILTCVIATSVLTITAYSSDQPTSQNQSTLAHNQQRVRQTCHCVGCKLTKVQLTQFKPGSEDAQQNHFAQSPGNNIGWIDCNLSQADLSYSSLKYSVFNVTLRGVLSPLFATRFNRSNLAHADLRHSHFYGASFIEANLSHSDLRYSQLSMADFRGANLHKANLAHAQSRVDAMHGWGTDWRNADFSGANLQGAKLYGLFQGANFDHANLKNACLASSTAAVANKPNTHPQKDPWHGTSFTKARQQHTSLVTDSSCSNR